MKLIAHRNETPGYPENSIASLLHSARCGIYAVECDVRRTLDGCFAIYHDDTLARLASDPRRVDSITLDQMHSALRVVGRSIITLDELIDGYTSDKPILLHIKERKSWPELTALLHGAKIEFIFGVESIEMLRALRTFTARDHLLAFMPRMDMYPDFIAEGAGIIRLWEPWLNTLSPDDVHAAGAEQVWIMCQTPEHGMDGSPKSLDRIVGLNADGALISDVEMGMRWLAQRSQ